MKLILPILALILSSCALPKQCKKQEVRLTVYWKTEDKWTNAGKTSTGGPLVSYKTLAADPRDFPYYSKISIPELGIVGTVFDTGSALKTRKAAKQMGKNVPVLDLYIEKRQDALDFIKGKPYFVNVEVEPQNEAQ